MAIKIVFDAYHLYHLPQFDPLIDLLQKDERFQLFFTSSADIHPKEQVLARQILSKRGECIFADTEEERAKKIRSLNPDVFICGWSRYPVEQFVPESTLVGMIYHGIGVKPSYWTDNHPRINVRFVEGQFRIEQLRAKGAKADLELTGLVKLDPLFNNSLPPKEKILYDWGLDINKRTVLYAPTFYPSSLESFGLKLPKMLLSKYNLIIKLHQWSYFLEKFSGVKLKRQVELVNKIKKKFPQVVVIEPEHYNIIDLYHVADVLVTEASSTIYEFMATRKHVVICDFYKKKLGHYFMPSRIYRRRLDRDMVQNYIDFCYHIEKPEELPEALRKCFEEPDPFVEIRERYIEDMLYKLDGKASERVRDCILKRVQKVG